MSGLNVGDVTGPRWVGGVNNGQAARGRDFKPLIEEFVAALTPAVTNETHAWNLWNILASDTGALRAALLRAYRADEALAALAESRARYGDLEARLVEAEAVIERARAEAAEWTKSPVDAISPTRGVGHLFLGLLGSAPSVVLADHDAAVWDQGFAAGAPWFGSDPGPSGEDEKPSNPYRVSGQHESTTDFLKAIDDLAGEA